MLTITPAGKYSVDITTLSGTVHGFNDVTGVEVNEFNSQVSKGNLIDLHQAFNVDGGEQLNIRAEAIETIAIVEMPAVA